MSEATERLLVRIDATTEQLRREMKRADDAVGKSSRNIDAKLKKIGDSFLSLSKSAAGLGAVIGAAGLAVAFKKITSATAEQEKATAQLNAVLLSTGGAAGKTADDLIATAASLQKVSRYGDEAIIGMQSLLLTFKQIKGDNFDRTTKAVLDMSTAMGQDLKSSAIQLGKALNDPLTGLSALSRVGITFSDTQKEMIKSMAESGKMAEAQVLILQELESQFGGSAEAARNTLGGALDGLSMAFGDLFEAQGEALEPMKDSLAELEAILSDPEFVDAVHKITAAIIEMGASVARAIPPTVDFLHFLAMEMGLAASNSAHLSGEIYDVEQQLKRLEKSGRGSSAQANRLKNELAELRGEFDALQIKDSGLEKLSFIIPQARAHMEKLHGSVEKTAKSSKELDKVQKSLAKSMSDMQKRHEKASKSIADSSEELDQLVETTDGYIEQLEWEISLVGKSAREQAILTAIREKGAKATEEQRDALAALTAELYDSQEAARVSAEAAKAYADAWQSSRDTLSNFFFEFARDGLNAFDTLVEGFKAMIVKMIAEAAANRIILGIGTAAGALGFPAAASAATSAASGGGLVSPLFAAGANYFAQNSSLFTNQGLQFAVPGDGGAALGPQFSWANAGYGLAGGLAGGYASNLAFGQTSGIGSTLGALGATLIPGLGPFLGPLLGSFFGGGAERLLGNVFGFGGKPGNNIGFADLGTGETGGYGTYNPANQTAATEIAAMLKQISDALGGGGMSGRVEVSDRGWVRLNGEKFTDTGELIAAFMKDVIAQSSKFGASLKTLISRFEGTTEETIAYATALGQISNLISDNPIDTAVKNFADSSELAGSRMVDIYEKQLLALDDLIYGFDGSVEAAAALNSALIANKQLAYDMATALSAIGESTRSVVRGEVDYFNQAVRTPDESLQYMERQLQFLDALIPKLTDPEQILAARDKALELNRAVFDAGPEDLQRANVQTFVDYANSVGEKTQIALDNAISSLGVTQDDLNTKTAAMLDVSAQGFKDASDTMYSAAELMYLAVQNFVNNNGGYSQVVA